MPRAQICYLNGQSGSETLHAVEISDGRIKRLRGRGRVPVDIFDEPTYNGILDLISCH